MTSPILTIDVAHPPRSSDAVEAELLDAWTQIRNSGSLHVVKIIHGYGSTGKGGSTKAFVQNWAFHHKTKFKRVIDGTHYNLYDNDTQEMRKEVGQYTDPDLQRSNPGVTVIWVK